MGRPLSADWPLLDPSGLPDPGRPRFCARCGAPTEERETGDRRRPICTRCGWTYYAKNAVGTAIVIERAGAVLLVKRAHDPYRGDWMLPGGFVEYGEDAGETALREVGEECALGVRLDGVFGYYLGLDDPRQPCYVIAYRATPTDPTVEPRAGDDAEAVGWFTRDGLPPNIAFDVHRRALADWRAATS